VIAKRVVLPVLFLLAFLAPQAASALELEIANESGRSDEDVYITVASPGAYNVTGATNNTPQNLSEIAGGKLTIDEIVSGRVYVSYGAGVDEATTFASPIRFDWAEFNFTGDDADVANLTAVDQFGIGMRLDTYAADETRLEGLGAANSDTIVAALQGVPGGPQATMRGPGGEFIRVLAPNKTGVYPDLGEYVRSLSGQTVTLRTAFFGSPFTTSVYSGTFGPDGSIVLSGTSNPPGIAPPTIALHGPELIADVYTGANTPNTLEGAIRRDLLSGFSTGFWGGRYGNDAIAFCSNPNTTAQGTWCPEGFNQPAFGDARLALSPFPTCEQYAAVINQYSDSYGNPYSDAAKKVQIGVTQSKQTPPVAVDRLKLTILPDSGDAQPEAGGNPNCGAGPAPAPAAAAPATGGKAAARATWVKVRFFKRATVRGRSARVARLTCGDTCGRVMLVAKLGRKVLGRGRAYVKGTKRALKLTLTGKGKRALRRSNRGLRVKLRVAVTPPGPKTTRRAQRILLRMPTASHQRHARR